MEELLKVLLLVASAIYLCVLGCNFVLDGFLFFSFSYVVVVVVYGSFDVLL